MDNNSTDKPQLDRFRKILEYAKSLSVTLVSTIIFIAILIVFGCSISAKSFPGLEEMNQFVSIVLGIVATIVSIISMLISFYGIEKTEESERRQEKVFQQMIDLEKTTQRAAQDAVAVLKESRTETKTSMPVEIPLDDFDAGEELL